MKPNILIVEDEPDLLKTLEFNLQSEGYQTQGVTRGEEALKKALNEPKPDLIVLDLMLPDISGLEVCKRIRNSDIGQDICILMLTAKGEEVDKVVGFELGADDYVVKPFSVRELVLRISAILKRNNKSEAITDEIEIGDLKIDISAHRVYIGNIEVDLNLIEFKLLLYLSERNGRMQTREMLLEKVWGYNNSITTRTVDTHIKRLRAKLGDLGNKIETVRGVGYRFNYII